jgi:hypothetical protein
MVPGGTGWQLRHGTQWTYRGAQGASIESISVRIEAGALGYRFKGSPAPLPPNSTAGALTLTVVPDATFVLSPTAMMGTCGEQRYQHLIDCRVHGRRLSCRSR